MTIRLDLTGGQENILNTDEAIIYMSEKAVRQYFPVEVTIGIWAIFICLVVLIFVLILRCRNNRRSGISDVYAAVGRNLSDREWFKFLGDFEKGIKRGEFKIYMQFFVGARTHKVVGGEALSRWDHPKLGMLNPSRYISLLEASGRIGKLDFYILEKTCEFLEKLDGCGVNDFFISCNFARKTFSSPDFAQRCIKIMKKYKFKRRLLVFEVTESQLIDSGEAGNMLKNIVDIRNYGAAVMFDDFGMGFSSYHDLQNYPMDGLKLDKELIDSIESENGRIIISALIDTGHKMGLAVLAEGVEKDRQIEILTELDCDVFQGFRFYVPLPEDEAYRYILEKRG